MSVSEFVSVSFMSNIIVLNYEISDFICFNCLRSSLTGYIST